MKQQMNVRDQGDGHVLQRPLTHCPGCHSDKLSLVAVPHSDEVNFVCADCHRRWHIELGFVHAV